MQAFLDTIVHLVKANISANISDSTIGLLVGIIVSVIYSACYDMIKYLVCKVTGKIIENKWNFLGIVAVFVSSTIVLIVISQLNHFIQKFVTAPYISIGLTIWLVWGLIISCFELLVNTTYVTGESYKEKENSITLILWCMFCGCTLGVPVCIISFLHGMEVRLILSIVIGIFVHIIIGAVCSWLAKKLCISIK